jgi:hypothetical protein
VSNVWGCRERHNEKREKNFKNLRKFEIPQIITVYLSTLMIMIKTKNNNSKELRPVTRFSVLGYWVVI